MADQYIIEIQPETQYTLYFTKKNPIQAGWTNFWEGIETHWAPDCAQRFESKKNANRMIRRFSSHHQRMCMVRKFDTLKLQLVSA